MRIAAAMLGTTLMAAFTLPSSATVHITGDRGGQLGPYLRKFELLRDSGQEVIVDGECLSACTLVLGLIPRDRLCVTSAARFGFHAAWRPNQHGHPVASPEGIEFLMGIYPHQVRDWIVRRGGLSSNVMYLTGRELASMYPTCPERDQSVVARSEVGPAHVFSRPLASILASRHKAGRRPDQP
jgi:hypothetical protein